MNDNNENIKKGGQGRESAKTNQDSKTNRLHWEPRVPLFDNPHGSTCGTLGKENNGSGKRRKISRDAEDMLIKVWNKPKLIMTALYKELDLSGYKGVKYKTELVRSGLVNELVIPTKKRGRKMKLLQINPKGRDYLRSLEIKREAKGRGGAKHLYYQNVIKDWYEARGFKAEIEASICGTCLYVLVIKSDGTRLGIEVAVSEQYEEINALKAIEAGIEVLIFVCENETVMKRIRHRIANAIPKQFRSKPEFKLVSDYLQSS